VCKWTHGPYGREASQSETKLLLGFSQEVGREVIGHGVGLPVLRSCGEAEGGGGRSSSQLALRWFHVPCGGVRGLGT
jgi:hypothetical protein